MGDPMKEGELAASNGEALSTNPYPNDSEAHEEWAEGWWYVHNSDEDGELKDDAA